MTDPVEQTRDRHEPLERIRRRALLGYGLLKKDAVTLFGAFDEAVVRAQRAEEAEEALRIAARRMALTVGVTQNLREEWAREAMSVLASPEQETK